VFQDKELVPVLSGPLKASAKPLAYFVVYPDKSLQEAPHIRVEFFVNGEELARSRTSFRRPILRRDTNGRERGHEARKVRDPDYAQQGLHSVTRSIAYTVAP